MSKSKYPRHLYDDKGNTIVVNSEEDESALQGQHYESPADVPANREQIAAEDEKPKAPTHPVEDVRLSVDPLPPGHTQRDRLVAEAENIGLKVDRRWSDERLMREIVEFASS